MAAEPVWQGLVSLLLEDGVSGPMAELISQVQTGLAELGKAGSPIGGQAFQGIQTAAEATIALIDQLDAMMAGLNAHPPGADPAIEAKISVVRQLIGVTEELQLVQESEALAARSGGVAAQEAAVETGVAVKSNIDAVADLLGTLAAARQAWGTTAEGAAASSLQMNTALGSTTEKAALLNLELDAASKPRSFIGPLAATPAQQIAARQAGLPVSSAPEIVSVQSEGARIVEQARRDQEALLRANAEAIPFDPEGTGKIPGSELTAITNAQIESAKADGLETSKLGQARAGLVAATNAQTVAIDQTTYDSKEKGVAAQARANETLIGKTARLQTEEGRARIDRVDTSGVDANANAQVRQAQLNQLTAEQELKNLDLATAEGRSRRAVLQAEIDLQRATEKRAAAEKTAAIPVIPGRSLTAYTQQTIENAGAQTGEINKLRVTQSALVEAEQRQIVAIEETNYKSLAEGTAALAASDRRLASANIRNAEERDKEAVRNADVSGVGDRGTSGKVRQAQLDEARATVSQQRLGVAQRGSVSEAEILAADIRLQRATEKRARVEEEAAKGGSGGFGAGTAFKYFALYQLFSLAEEAFRGMVSHTEQYSLAVNQLAIAMDTTTTAVTDQANSYAAAGSKLATAPAVAINAGAQYTRVFQDRSGVSGDVGAQLGSTINLLEAKTAKDGEEEALVKKRLDDLSAIGLNYHLDAGGTKDLYGAATYIGQHYGQQHPGDILAGTAQISDLTKQTGFTAEQAIALVAAVGQRSGQSGDAVASDVKRILAKGGSGTFNSLFNEYGIDSSPVKPGGQGGIIAELQKLAVVFKKLPEGGAQQTSIVNSLGGPRSGGAFLNVIENLGELLDTAAKGKAHPGEADVQAGRELKVFAGEIKTVRNDILNLTNDLSKTGLGGVLGALLLGVDAVVNALDILVKGLNTLHGSANAAVAAAGLVALAWMKPAAITATTGFFNRLSPFAASPVAGQSEQAANTEAILLHTRALNGETAAEIEAAAAASVDAEAQTAVGLREAASGLVGLAAAAGGAALALAPLVLAVGAIILLGKKHDAEKSIAEGKTRYDKAVKTGDAAGGDIESLKGAIAGIDDSTAKLRTGNWGVDPIASGPLKFSIGPSVPGAGTRSVKEQLRIEAEKRAKYAAELKVAEDAQAAAATTGSNGSVYGPGYDNIDSGNEALTTGRLGAHDASKQMLVLLAHTKDIVRLGNELTPAATQTGFVKPMTALINSIAKEQDPSKQLADLKDLQGVAQAALAKAKASGKASVIGGAQDLLDQVNQPLYQLVVKNTSERVASIKAFEGDGAKSQAKIRAIIISGLRQTAGGSDITGTIALIALGDKALLKSFNDIVAAERSLLQVKIAGLRAAVQAASVSAIDGLQGDLLAPDSQQPPVDKKKAAAVAAANKALADAEAKLKANGLTQGTIATATPLSSPGSQGSQGPSPAQIEEARLASLVIPGDPLSAATAAVTAAKYKVDHPKDQLEYWTAVKAFHEAQYAFSQAQNTATDAAISAGATAGDPISQASAALRVANSKVANAVGAAAKSDAAKGAKDAAYTLSQAYEASAEAQIASREISGDSLSQARGSLEIARVKLRSAVGSTAYYSALKGLRDAQYALAQAEQTRANDAFQLHLDLTNPVVVAREKVREAVRQLAFDRGRGADTTKDRLQLKQDRSAAEKASFDQTFSDHQTNYNLQRESLSAYLSYLNSQHRYLTHVHSKTRQQVDELNQVDQALKSLTDGMQGQFNLGQIKMPTPYEVRRSMATGASQAQTTVHINISGADTGAIKGVLAQYLGQAAMATAGTSVRKV